MDLDLIPRKQKDVQEFTDIEDRCSRGETEA